MNYDKLESAVLENIRGFCQQYVDDTHFENIVEEAKKRKDLKTKITNEISKLDIKINQITNHIDKSYVDKLEGLITLEMYNRNVLKFNEEIDNLKNRKKELIDKLNNMGSSDSNKEKEETLIKIKEFLSFEKPTRELLVNLIDRIEISEDKTVEIKYKFRLI